MKYTKLIRWIACIVVVMGSCVWAVSDQEVAMMKNAMPDKPVVTPGQERTMLVFSLCKGFQHSSIPYWKKALDIMSEKTGAFKVVHSDDMGIFNDDSLKQFDVICFNNTTQLEPDESQQNAIMNFIRNGKGIVGIHAATDNFNKWPAGKEMMGGVFTGHPWGGGGTWAIKIDDPSHPLMKSFKGQGFKIKDEIYRTAPPLYSRDKQRVLMSLDMSDPTTRNAEGVVPDDMDTGISWIKSVGKGRLFYCSLGHDHAVTWNRPVLEHYVAGIQYAMGDLKVDDTPVPAGVVVLDTATLDALISQLGQYDWGSKTEGVYQLQAMIKDQYTNPQAIQIIEEKLLTALNSDASLAAKDFVCRQLALMGTERSIPTLTKMLAKDETANIGRYALDRIPGQEADKAMLGQLSKAQDDSEKIGIISSLGIRKCDDVVNVLSGYMKNTNDAVAVAAVQALGYIGSEKAADELGRFNAGDNDYLSMRVLDAQLACAQSLVKENEKYAAQKICRRIYEGSSPSLYRAAALMGLSEAGDRLAGKLIPEAIAGDDTVLQETAIQLVSSLEDKQILQATASILSDLPDSAQIQLIAALAQNPMKIGKADIEKAAASTNKDVRIAAYRGLAMVGDGNSVELLAKGAVVSDRDESQAAKESLDRISGRGVNSAILNGITAGGDEAVRVALIRAAVSRQIDGATAVLFKTAISSERKIASESIRGLQTLGQPGDLAGLVDLLIAKPGTPTENALIVVANKVEDQNQRARAILAKYPSVQDKDAKVSMLLVMGRLGDTHSISILKKEYASSDAAISEAALRAMSTWPGADFIGEMKQLVQNAKDTKSKVVAFRAYVRMLTDSNMDSAQVVDDLIEAYNTIGIENEQRRVVSAMNNFGSDKALDFLEKVYQDSPFKAEAEVSLVGVCEKLAWTRPEKTKAILKDIAAQSTNDSVKKNASELLGLIDKHAGFVMSWEVSGPYQAEGKNGEALFDVAFEPESFPAGVKWQSAIGLISDTKGVFDLSKLEKGNERVAYLKTVLTSSEDKDAVLEIGSDDGVKVWLNGKLVHANNASRPLSQGQDKANVKLKQGDNRFLVKIVQRQGDWAFCMKVVD